MNDAKKRLLDLDTAPLPLPSVNFMPDLAKYAPEGGGGRAAGHLALMDKAAGHIRAGQFGQAIAIYDTIIASHGDTVPQAHFRRLYAAVKAHDFELAAVHYLEAQKLVSNENERVFVEQVWLNCLRAGGYLEEALALAQELVKTKTPSHKEIKGLLALILMEMNRAEEALPHHLELVKAWPDYSEARWHLSLNQLRCGHLEDGWKNYEARWNAGICSRLPNIAAVPQWKGEPLDGKQLLVWREQGVGDEIRNFRFVRDIPAEPGSVCFAARGKLSPLFERSLPGLRMATEDDIVNCETRFDYQIPVGSLVGLLRPKLEQMLEDRGPWLKRNSAGEDVMRSRINPRPKGPVIGLTWRSGFQNLVRNQYYIPADALAPLQVINNATFVCLQYDECGDELHAMREHGLDIVHFDDIDQKDDLVTTADLIGACDLVISAGTAVAELSAALGKPTILFGKPGAYIKLGTEGMPWHPYTLYLNLDPDDPLKISRDILTNWPAIANWAESSPDHRTDVDWTTTLPH